MCCSLGDLFLGIIAIIFPPFPVWVRRGLCSADSLINILLCVLGYIPGLIHAWYVIAITPSYYDEGYYQDLERQGGQHQQHHHVAYFFVDGRDGQRHPVNKPGSGPNYGTVSAARSSAPASAPQSSSQSSAPAPQPQAPAAPQNQTDNTEDAGEGSASGPPPTYADAVKGDHKIQHDD